MHLNRLSHRSLQLSKPYENNSSRALYSGAVNVFVRSRLLFLLFFLCVALPVMAQDMVKESVVQMPDLPIPSAIQFPIIIKTVLDSTRATNGDPVEGELKDDLVIGDNVVAPAGSAILGHVEKLRRSRRLTESALSKRRRFHTGSTLKVVFDEIITPDDEHLKIVGCLSKQIVTFEEADQPRCVEIGPDGELRRAEAVFTDEQKVTSSVVNFAASTGLNPLGTVASMGALPVVLGVIGAVDPALVATKPLSSEERHPRVKGFAYGVFQSLPGAPVIQAVAFKGSELRLEPGDELLVQAHSPYEPISVLAISGKILKKGSGTH